MLKRDGVIVLELEALGAAPPPKASVADVTVFTRQLAGLLRAGRSPVRSICSPMPARAAACRVSCGRSLAISRAAYRSRRRLSSHPTAFGTLPARRGRRSRGRAARRADASRDDRERAASQRAKLRGALAYPYPVMVLLSLAITAGLLIGVVPTFKTIFDGFGTALPAPTRFVLALSDGVARHAPFAAVRVSCCSLHAG